MKYSLLAGAWRDPALAPDWTLSVKSIVAGITAKKPTDHPRGKWGWLRLSPWTPVLTRQSVGVGSSGPCAQGERALPTRVIEVVTTNRHLSRHDRMAPPGVQMLVVTLELGSSCDRSGLDYMRCAKLWGHCLSARLLQAPSRVTLPSHGFTITTPAWLLDEMQLTNSWGQTSLLHVANRLNTGIKVSPPPRPQFLMFYFS